MSLSTDHQLKIQEDKQAIKAMAGSYSIRFQFVETLSPDPEYTFQERYSSKATEWITVVDESDTKISLQHLLIVGPGKVIKHWRQDWIYENTNFYVYEKDLHWKYRQLTPDAVRGQWTQKVYQVDDSLRYEASGIWVHSLGKHYWEGEVDAPLPRREEKRNDYNIMVRRNRHEITDFGHIHEQDNRKVQRENGKDSIIVMEKGLNTYTKIEDNECQAAMDWWDENNRFWSEVRSVFEHIYLQNNDLHYIPVIEGKMLYERLLTLGQEVNQAPAYDQGSVISQISTLINQHIMPGTKVKAAI